MDSRVHQHLGAVAQAECPLVQPEGVTAREVVGWHLVDPPSGKDLPDIHFRGPPGRQGAHKARHLPGPLRVLNAQAEGGRQAAGVLEAHPHPEGFAPVHGIGRFPPHAHAPQAEEAGPHKGHELKTDQHPENDVKQLVSGVPRRRQRQHRH